MSKICLSNNNDKIIILMLLPSVLLVILKTPVGVEIERSLAVDGIKESIQTKIKNR